ncbi:GNAT family N-acetyltransferase [Nocardioides sp.]|uniref:GNAT family N-acetyltransferase n=1 Tax=Nocardioides sp. TaxID=35761 RepID=UPI0035282B6F
MTPLRSPGFATDLALLRLSGAEFEDRDDHVVVRSPANPTYHWGNCVYLRRAPERGSLGGWLDVFRAAHPDAGHVAIGIDDPDADPDPDEAAGLGLEIERDMVLTAAALHSGPAPEGYRLVRAEVDDDALWGRLVELEMTDGIVGTPESHRVFVTRRLDATRALAAAGHGTWCAALTSDDTPVASLGIYAVGGGRARYQSVLTHPDHRRRGLAGALVRFAGEYAGSALAARELVIVADATGPAIALYRRAGLADHTPQVSLYHPG